MTVEVYVMSPGDEQWKANIEKRNLQDNIRSYKNEADEIEFPNSAEGIDAVYEVVDGEVRLRMEPPRPEIFEKAREELAQEAERIRKEDEEERKCRELLDSMNERPFWHYCEVCGKKEFITAKEAFESGWDYPPDMGRFGMLGPRTCGECQMTDTLFWKKQNNSAIHIVLEENLSPEELVTWHRIIREPESLLDEE